MIDVKKLNTRIKLDIILLWVEMLQKKQELSKNEKEAVSLITDYIFKEVSK